MTDEWPAPEYSVELASCNCQVTRCTENYCKCKKNNLNCNDLYNCEGCENSEDLAADIQLEDGDTGDEEGNEQEGV